MELHLVQCSGDNDDGSKFGENGTEQIRTVAAVSELKNSATEEKLAAVDAQQKPMMKSKTGMCFPRVKLKSHIPSSAGNRRATSFQASPSSNLETKMVKEGNLTKESSAGNLKRRGTKKLQSQVKTGEPKYLENGSSTLSKSGEIPKIRNAVNQTPRNQAKVNPLPIYHKPNVRPGEGRPGATGGDKRMDVGRRLSQLSDVTSGTSGRNRNTSATLSQMEPIKGKLLRDKSCNDAKTLNKKESPIQQTNNKTGHNESSTTGCCPETSLQTGFESNAANKVSPQKMSCELKNVHSPSCHLIRGNADEVGLLMPELVVASFSNPDQMSVECEEEERFDSEFGRFAVSQNSKGSSLGILDEADMLYESSCFALDASNDTQQMSCSEKTRIGDGHHNGYSSSEIDCVASRKNLSEEKKLTDIDSRGNDGICASRDPFEQPCHSDELKCITLLPVSEESREKTVLTEEEIRFLVKAVNISVNKSKSIDGEDDDNANAGLEIATAVDVNILPEVELPQHRAVANDFFCGNNPEETASRNLEIDGEIGTEDMETSDSHVDVNAKEKELENGDSCNANDSNMWTIVEITEDEEREVKTDVKINFSGKRKGEGNQVSLKKVFSLSNKLKQTEPITQDAPKEPKTVANAKGKGSPKNSFLQQPRTVSLNLGNADGHISASLKRSDRKKETVPQKAFGIREKDKEPTSELPVNRTTSQPNSSSQQSSAVPFSSGVLKKQNEMPSEKQEKHYNAVPVVKNAILQRTSAPVLSKVDHASRVRAGGRDIKQEQEIQNKKGINSKNSTPLKGSGQLKQKTAASSKNCKSSDDNRESEHQPQAKQSEQRYRQPDLVPNEVAVEKRRSETNELESLCQSFALQVNLLKAEVSRRNDRFHALLIAAQYFLQMSDAEERRELRDRLKSTLENLNATRMQLEDLMRERDALNDKMRSLKEEEDLQKNRLLQEHQLRLRELEESLQLLHNENIDRLMESNSEKLSSLEMKHCLEVKKLKEKYDQELSENEKEHFASLSMLKSQHEELLHGLKEQHDVQLNDITLYFEHMKLSLSEKVKILRNECEEMQRKESDYMESCQRDMEEKLNFALLPFRHLPQEIESLESVLELRNVELHSLRCQNLELHRQLEELPVAHEMIRRLEQKVENLEAVADIRTDYERELSEKHQQLLRRMERESKANKRLSMDNEELLWRLSFQATDLPPSVDSGQQMLKSSPISGGDSSVVGDASKLASHPRLPSAAHNNPPDDMRMQRSETYDLFCQNLNDVGTDKMTSPVLLNK